MGQLKTDGRAIDVAAPGSTVLNNEELYRIDGWNGISMRAVSATDADRGLAFETSSERIWYIKTPSGIGTTRGAVLYWATPGSFQKGDTHLQATAATAGDPPACKVEEVRDAGGYAAVRVLNVG